MGGRGWSIVSGNSDMVADFHQLQLQLFADNLWGLTQLEVDYHVPLLIAFTPDGEEKDMIPVLQEVAKKRKGIIRFSYLNG